MMDACINRPGSVALLLLLLSACGPEPVPCGTDCQDVSGSYAVDVTTVSGTCGFAAYQVPPTVNLVQSEDLAQISTLVLDPVNKIDVQLTGPLYQPKESDPDGTLATFSIYSQTARQSTQDDPQMLNLRILMSGSVVEKDGARTLSGTLSTADLSTGEGGGCQVNLSFSASD